MRRKAALKALTWPEPKLETAATEKPLAQLTACAVLSVNDEVRAIMGKRAVRQEALVYGFNLNDHVPADHLLRSIDRFVELSITRRQLAPTTAPSVSPRSTPN